jgi:hypothetical protein
VFLGNEESQAKPDYAMIPTAPDTGLLSQNRTTKMFP